MKRRRAGAVLSAIGTCAAIAWPAGAGSHPVTWKQAATAFAWPVLRPSTTSGLRLTSLRLDSSPCDNDFHYQAYTASYGAIPPRGFDLHVARRKLCGDGSEAVGVGHVVIRGHRASVFVVMPRDGHTPTIAEAYEDGLVITWREGSTDIYFETDHIRLSEAVRIVRGLRPVPG